MGLFQDSDKGLKLDVKYGLHYVIEGAEILPFSSPPVPEGSKEQPQSYLAGIECQASKSALYEMMMFNRSARDSVTYQDGIGLRSAVDSLLGMAGKRLDDAKVGLGFKPDTLRVSAIQATHIDPELMRLLNARCTRSTENQEKTNRGRG